MKHLILLSYLVLLASCNQTSPFDLIAEENGITEQQNNPRRYPSWVVIQKKTGFIFEDKQNLIKSLKLSGIDSVLIARSWVYRSNDSDTNIDYDGVWSIPENEDVKDTTFTFIEGIDTTIVTVETKVFPVKSFRFKGYKLDKRY